MWGHTFEGWGPLNMKHMQWTFGCNKNLLPELINWCQQFGIWGSDIRSLFETNRISPQHARVRHAFHECRWHRGRNVLLVRRLDGWKIKKRLNSEQPEEANCFCHRPHSECSEARRFPPDLSRTSVSSKCIINATRLLCFQVPPHNTVSVFKMTVQTKGGTFTSQWLPDPPRSFLGSALKSSVVVRAFITLARRALKFSEGKEREPRVRPGT